MDSIQTVVPTAMTMPRSGKTLTCDQAVFTSVRTLTGEGYRIVAASKGVRADEKQAITRHSPSHDSLCVAENDGAEAPLGPVKAIAFYTLPSSRFCLAVTSLAGDEHTGRGGKRVYTLNLLLDQKDLGRFAWNPFQVVRALVSSGHANPDLKLPAPLPMLDFDTDGASSGASALQGVCRLSTGARMEALSQCMQQGACILPLESNWLECAEEILLGMPGPMRSRVSFVAGLKFSTSRMHRLMVIMLDASSKPRIASCAAKCIDPQSPRTGTSSEWLTFVERHWSNGDLSGLDRRTSRAFPDCGPEAMNRIGRWFNQMDSLHQAAPESLIGFAVSSLDLCRASVEAEIRAELHTAAKTRLLKCIDLLELAQVTAIWTRLLLELKRNPHAVESMRDVVERVLVRTSAFDPLLAFTLFRDARRDQMVCPNEPVPERMLTALSQWLVQMDPQTRPAAIQQLTNAAAGFTPAVKEPLDAILRPYSPGTG